MPAWIGTRLSVLVAAVSGERLVAFATTVITPLALAATELTNLDA